MISITDEVISSSAVVMLQWLNDWKIQYNVSILVKWLVYVI